MRGVDGVERVARVTGGLVDKVVPLRRELDASKCPELDGGSVMVHTTHLGGDGRPGGDVDHGLGGGLVVGVYAAVTDDVVRGDVGEGL